MNLKDKMNGRLLFCAAGILALVTVLLGVLAVLNCWDSGTNYFLSESRLPAVAVGFAFLTALFGSAAACFSKNAKNPFDSGLEIPFPSVGLLFSGALLLSSSGTLAKITSLLLLVGSVYPVLLAFPNFKRRLFLVPFGFVTTASFLFFNVTYYFDATVEMNAPVKSVLEIFLISAALWYIEGLRYPMGNPLPRFYPVVGAWTASAASLAGIPVILSYCTGKINRLDYLAGGILALSVLADVVTRTAKMLRRN